MDMLSLGIAAAAGPRDPAVVAEVAGHIHVSFGPISKTNVDPVAPSKY